MGDYYSVVISIKPYSVDAADLLAAFLADEGFESFVENPEGLTAYIQTSLFDENSLQRIAASFPFEAEIEWDMELIEQKDWNEEWEKKYFKPLLLGGGRCVVHSSFHEDYPAADIDITIDPKMAFGTGHHATTTMMVNHLFDLDLHGKKVLDMGTGTAILAIIAKKLGAAEVTGIEIDPMAWENAIDNARLNNAEVKLLKGDSTLLENIREVDIFLANINRNIILADLDSYTATMKTGATLVLSGFYNSDIPLLKGALEASGLKIHSTAEEAEGWASIRAVKVS